MIGYGGIQGSYSIYMAVLGTVLYKVGLDCVYGNVVYIYIGYTTMVVYMYAIW